MNEREGCDEYRYDLIPEKPLKEVARAYGIGAKKHSDVDRGERSWEFGVLCDKLERHWKKFRYTGVKHDEEGQHHLAAVIIRAMQLLELEGV